VHKSSLFYGASNNISPRGASGAADNLSALFSKASLSLSGAHFNIKNFFSARLGIIKRVNQFCIFFSMSSLKSRLFHIEKDKHAYILCCYLGGIFSQRARTAAIARNEGIFSRAHYFISYGAQKFPHALKCIFARDAAAAAAVTERGKMLYSHYSDSEVEHPRRAVALIAHDCDTLQRYTSGLHQIKVTCTKKTVCSQFCVSFPSDTR
jgi:hypothetical protein